MRIRTIVIDEGNVDHVTRRVPLAEIESMLRSSPRVVRNRKDRAGDYRARGNGIEVVFRHEGGGAVRPITAWRLER